ncbi:MAG: hypothetical protein V1821_02905 [bacterium]
MRRFVCGPSDIDPDCVATGFGQFQAGQMAVTIVRLCQRHGTWNIVFGREEVTTPSSPHFGYLLSPPDVLDEAYLYLVRDPKAPCEPGWIARRGDGFEVTPEFVEQCYRHSRRNRRLLPVERRTLPRRKKLIA